MQKTFNLADYKHPEEFLRDFKQKTKMSEREASAYLDGEIKKILEKIGKK